MFAVITGGRLKGCAEEVEAAEDGASERPVSVVAALAVAAAALGVYELTLGFL